MKKRKRVSKKKPETANGTWTTSQPQQRYFVKPMKADGKTIAYAVDGPGIIMHRTDPGEALTLCRVIQNAYNIGHVEGAGSLHQFALAVGQKPKKGVGTIVAKWTAETKKQSKAPR